MRKSAAVLAVLVFAVIAVCVAGCSSTPRVTRVSDNAVTDISGRWNDTDSRQVAEKIVGDCLQAPWLNEWMSANANKRPVVIVGTIVNKSHEHINTETFINDIQRYLVNSGKVEFVANKGERQELRSETADQAANAAVDSRQVAGEESGADLMLLGSINSIVDQEGGKAVVFYQINLELVQIETHKKVWIGDKKIKKFVENSSTKF